MNNVLREERISKEAYIITNNGIVFLKGGIMCNYNQEDLTQLDVFARDGYQSEESAKSALRRLKNSKRPIRFNYYIQPKPNDWSIQKIRVSKTYNVFKV